MNTSTYISKNQYRHIDLGVMAFILGILFLMPLIFTRIHGQISWIHVTKIWMDQLLLIPLFAFNHWWLVPRMLFGHRTGRYLIFVLSVIVLVAVAYHLFEQHFFGSPADIRDTGGKPAPVPPYANLLMYSLLITGVDSGLLIMKKWYEDKEQKHLLEVKNVEIQLNSLKSQVSPHFFMNTLNNIYALIDCDTLRAKEAVMKLSRLMRYMLYDNEHGKVKLNKEFEFIRSYVDLMKLRFADQVNVQLHLPADLVEVEIAPMLFICYIENAFKHGISYQHESFIHILFEKRNNLLYFSCTNSKNTQKQLVPVGGLGLRNNENRLKLLYHDHFKLVVDETDKTFNVTLEIPIA